MYLISHDVRIPYLSHVIHTQTIYNIGMYFRILRFDIYIIFE